MADDYNNIEALAFDHYGTLFNKHAVAEMLESAFPGQGQPVAETWFRTIKKYCWLSGMMDRYLPWSDLTKRALVFSCKSFGLSLPDGFYEELIQADLLLPPFPEVPAALERLSKKLDLYVLTMGSPWMVEASQRNAGVEKLFKGIISTEPLELYKPGSKSYDVGVQEIGLPKEKIGFVSGNSFDVMGAVNYGFPTFWINRTGAPLDELGLEPDLTLPDLTGLADALNA